MKAALSFPVPLKLGEGHRGMLVEHLLYVRHWLVFPYVASLNFYNHHVNGSWCNFRSESNLVMAAVQAHLD